MTTDRVRWSLTAALAAALLAGCADPGPKVGAGDGPTPADPVPPDAETPPWPGFPAGPPPCDPNVSVKAGGPALLVRDPEVLAHFPLQKVLQQLVDLPIATNVPTPEELLQRLFDTENSTATAVFADNVHCDSAGNGAFKNGAPVGCPRAEGALAKSAGLFVPGDPDYFAPVALVNRFDLTAKSTTTCGEYRIVYAKWSGRSDPNDRLFLIFEGALANPRPGEVWGCWPVAKAWANLEKETDPAKIAASLEAFYFTGLPGFSPLIDRSHFGLSSNDDAPYGRSHGQVRVSQRMEDPWELREFHLRAAPLRDGPSIFFAPVTVKNSPIPGLFALADQSNLATFFRAMFLADDVPALAAADLASIRMQTQNGFNAGESALTGPAAASYEAQIMSGDSAAFLDAIQARIDDGQLDEACPPRQPLRPMDIVNRAAVQSCAGCHAPQNFLGPAQKIGCGLTWPSSLGEAHIDEKGNLSPALTDVFLPRRAAVMTTFVQACDLKAIEKNLQPSSPSGGIPK